MQRRRGGGISRFPNDVWLQIFYKLPFKSTACFKLVCKEWNSTISDPNFMKHYNPPIDNQFFIFENVDYFKFNIYTLNYSNLLNNESKSSVTPLNDPYTWGCKFRGAKFVGSYNGLVAISCNYRTLVLCNPLTKIFTCVSGDYWFFNLEYGYSSTPRAIWGLCYDSSSQEYSVVIAHDYQSPPTSPTYFDVDISYEGQDVYIVECKTGNVKQLSRTRIGGRLLDKKLFGGEAGMVVCGVPHWVVQTYNYGDFEVQREIIYFDLKEEKFKQIPKPDIGTEKTMLGLATLDGEQQLGVVVHHISASSLEIWVMKKYGVFESWTNLFNMPYPGNFDDSLQCMDVLRLKRNAELLIHGDSKWFMVYDIENGTSSKIELWNEPQDVRIALYKESLISPPGSERNNVKKSSA